MDYQSVLLYTLAILILAYSCSSRARFEIRCLLVILAIFFSAVVSVPLCFFASFIGKAPAAVLMTLRVFLSWTGINVETRNHEVLEKYPSSCVILCNHQSTIDHLVIAHSMPSRCTVMMKRSLAFIPFFNVVAWLCDSIFVDRFNRENAMKTVQQCTKAMKEKNLKLWVFPEGTRNRALDGLLPFKKGAFNIAVEAQIPIFPIVASSLKSFYFHDGHYFDNDGEIIVQVMDPIPTAGLTREDVPRLADEVREKMLVVYRRITEEANEKMTLKRGEKAQR